jgi:hypothetical protein
MSKSLGGGSLPIAASAFLGALRMVAFDHVMPAAR